MRIIIMPDDFGTCAHMKQPVALNTDMCLDNMRIIINTLPDEHLIFISTCIDRKLLAESSNLAEIQITKAFN